MNIHSSLRRIGFAILLLLTTTLVGILGYSIIEGYSWLDSAFMTIITMSTVGFGTLSELSGAGKLFSILLIIFSAGTFIYGVTTITTFIVEGEIQSIFHRYKINRRVSKLEGHIIICGLGRNGREAAMELERQNHAFVIIEADEKVIDEFYTHHSESILIVLGDATQEDILEKANIRTAKGLVSSLATDAENVYITLTAREMNPELNIVARASQESTISKLKKAGANEVIIPNVIGGRRMVNLITRPSMMEFIDLVTGEGNPDLFLEDVLCENYPKLIGKSLSELQIRSHTGVSVIGFKRASGYIYLNPPPHKDIEPDDRLYILGSESQLKKFRERYLD